MHLEKHISETFIPVLKESGTENLRKNLMCWKILIRSFIVQIVMMLMLINIINMVLSAEHY